MYDINKLLQSKCRLQVNQIDGYVSKLSQKERRWCMLQKVPSEVNKLP